MRTAFEVARTSLFHEVVMSEKESATGAQSLILSGPLKTFEVEPVRCYGVTGENVIFAGLPLPCGDDDGRVVHSRVDGTQVEIDLHATASGGAAGMSTVAFDGLCAAACTADADCLEWSVHYFRVARPFLGEADLEYLFELVHNERLVQTSNFLEYFKYTMGYAQSEWWESEGATESDRVRDLPPQLTEHFAPLHLEGIVYRDAELEFLFDSRNAALHNRTANWTSHAGGRDLYGELASTAAYRVGRQCNLCSPAPGAKSADACDRVEIDPDRLSGQSLFLDADTDESDEVGLKNRRDESTAIRVRVASEAGSESDTSSSSILDEPTVGTFESVLTHTLRRVF